MALTTSYLGSISAGALPIELQMMIYSDKSLTMKDLSSLECTCRAIQRIVMVVWELKALKELRRRRDPQMMDQQDKGASSDDFKKMIKRYQQGLDEKIGDPCVGASWGKYFFKSQLIFNIPETLIAALGGYKAAVNIPVFRIQNSHLIRDPLSRKKLYNDFGVFFDIRPGEMEYPVMRIEHSRRTYFALKCITKSTSDPIGEKYVLVIDNSSSMKDPGFVRFFKSQYFKLGNEWHADVKCLVSGDSIRTNDYSAKSVRDKRHLEYHIKFYRKQYIQLAV